METYKIDINKLKTLDNSRLRTVGDVSDLIESIKENGLLQPIVVRRSDNAIICGNRRYSACKKLGLKTIDVVYKDNVTDLDLVVLNLIENMNRKDINSIEIGRQCKVLLEKFNLSEPEIAKALGIVERRVRICITAFERTPEEFRTSITYGTLKGQARGIPENVLMAIVALNSHKTLAQDEYEFLLKKARDDKLTIKQLTIIRYLISMLDLSVPDAYNSLDKYRVVWTNIVFDKKELERAMHKEKTNTVTDFLNKVVDTYNNKLLA